MPRPLSGKPARVSTEPPLAAPAVLNGTWALDFMHDALYGGRRFRTLNVLDEGNRQGLGIDIGTSIPSARVVRLMEQLIEVYGRPAAVRVDNGPELTAQVFVDWCAQQDIELRYIQPGKPDQNAYIERFNRSYREEVLSAYLFDNVDLPATLVWFDEAGRHQESLDSERPVGRLKEIVDAADSPWWFTDSGALAGCHLAK